MRHSASSRSRHPFSIVAALIAASCSSSEPSTPAGSTELEPGQPVEGVLAGDEASRARFAQLAGEVERLRELSASALLSEYPIQHGEQLGYAPLDAARLELIQASALSLNDAELGLLASNGFVPVSLWTVPPPTSPRSPSACLLRAREGFASAGVERLPTMGHELVDRAIWSSSESPKYVG